MRTERNQTIRASYENFNGHDVVQIAAKIAAKDGHSYSLQSAPSSLHKGLSGNKHPGVTLLTWLKGRNKCNQFVGEVLHQAGWKMPTYKMQDGSEHYRNAEALLNAFGHFQRVPTIEEARPGDVIVIDNPARNGENGAHVEILTEVDWTSGGRFFATGARRDGVRERDYTYGIRQALRSGNLYLLRPKLAVGTDPSNG